MYTLEIALRRSTGEGWPVVVEQTPPGVFLPVRSEGLLRLDLDRLRAQATPRDYGTVLGQALFQDGVRDAFVRARAESGDDLRILLAVETGGDGVDDLRGLRWERLCAPFDGDWDFLALHQRTCYSLYLPSLTDRRFPPIGRHDLRALVVVACPTDLPAYALAPFDVRDAVAQVRAALGEIPCDVLATLDDVAGPPTLDALCERLTAEPYTLLHLVGHGTLTRDSGESVVFLESSDGQADPVTSTRLIERVRRVRGPRGLPHFAFVAACDSASPTAGGALGGLAQRLVSDLGMPAVLAMTERITIQTAGELTSALYRRLRAHGQVDLALAEACAGLAERHDVIVPALFSRLGGRPLFSDALDQPLGDGALMAGLDLLTRLVDERGPVLAPALAAQAVILQRQFGPAVGALSASARAEREQALAELNALSTELLDLSFPALALGQAPPTYDNRCPFRGLYPFRADDHAFFFGREELVEQLRRRLAEHSFLAVLGPSGSGKSRWSSPAWCRPCNKPTLGSSLPT